MGMPVLVLGASGSGKSTSLRNFKKGEVFVFSVAGKRLPFKEPLDIELNSTYQSIGKKMMEMEYKTYVIDDSQYLLAFEMFERAKENGYGKFTDIAVRFRNMIDYITRSTPDDTIVYLLHHSEVDDSGRIKAKTVGKMLDNQLTVEGLFTIVLLTQTDGQNYRFITQNDGGSPAKAPLGMFDREIDNDLKMVDETIRQYYGMEGTNEKN